MDKKDWLLIKSLFNSLSLSEIARRTGIPKSTISRRLQNLLTQKIKVKYVVSKKALGLTPLLLITENKVSDLPSYTISCRKGITSGNVLYVISAYVPTTHISSYLSLLSQDPLFIFECDDILIWNPILSEKYGVVDLNKNEIHINFKRLSKVENEIIEFRRINPDIYDLLIITYKENNPFLSLSKISKKGYKDYIFVKRQTLSYHFRKHVIPIWLGNSIRIYRPLSEYPVRLFIFEACDVENLAFKLSLIPRIFTIYYSRDVIIFSAQLNSLEVFKLYKNILVHHKARPLVCELYLEPSFVKFGIMYHYLWSNGWIKPKVAYKVRMWRD